MNERIDSMQNAVNEMITDTRALILEMRATLYILDELCNEANKVILQNSKRKLPTQDPIVWDCIEEGTFKEQYAEYRKRLKRTYHFE